MWLSIPFLCLVSVWPSGADNITALNQEGNSTVQGDGGGLKDIEIAPKAITSMQYGNSRLSIWEHLKNVEREPDKKQYFVMPLIQLQPDRCNCSYNVFTQTTRLDLYILMWSDDLASAALKHMQAVTLNTAMKFGQIKVLPYEEIRLVWVSSTEQFSNHFQLNTDWQSNQENIVKFEIAVTDMAKCSEALESIQRQPDVLSDLELQYILHGKQTATKDIVIDWSHVQDAKMYSDLSNLMDEKGDVYLNSRDTNTLARQIIDEVTATVITDSTYVDSGDELSMTKLVESKLTETSTESSKMTQKLWDSTFWNPTWARPDNTTATLNKIIRKNDGETHTVNIDDEEYKKSRKWGFNVDIPLLAKGGVHHSTSSEKKNNISEDDLRDWLKEQDIDAVWNGESFDVKPMKLNRLNLQAISTQGAIKSQSIQVHRVQYTVRVPVYLPVPPFKQRHRRLTVSALMDAVQLQMERNRAVHMKDLSAVNAVQTSLAQRVSSANDSLHEASMKHTSDIKKLDTLITEWQKLLPKAGKQTLQCAFQSKGISKASETASCSGKVMLMCVCHQKKTFATDRITCIPVGMGRSSCATSHHEDHQYFSKAGDINKDQVCSCKNGFEGPHSEGPHGFKPIMTVYTQVTSISSTCCSEL